MTGNIVHTYWRKESCSSVFFLQIFLLPSLSLIIVIPNFATRWQGNVTINLCFTKLFTIEKSGQIFLLPLYQLPTYELLNVFFSVGSLQFLFYRAQKIEFTIIFSLKLIYLSISQSLVKAILLSLRSSVFSWEETEPGEPNMCTRSLDCVGNQKFLQFISKTINNVFLSL